MASRGAGRVIFSRRLPVASRTNGVDLPVEPILLLPDPASKGAFTLLDLEDLEMVSGLDVVGVGQ